MTLIVPFFSTPTPSQIKAHLSNVAISVPVEDCECGLHRRLGDVALLQSGAEELRVVELAALVDVDVAEERLVREGKEGEIGVMPILQWSFGGRPSGVGWGGVGCAVWGG